MPGIHGSGGIYVPELLDVGFGATGSAGGGRGRREPQCVGSQSELQHDYAYLRGRLQDCADQLLQWSQWVAVDQGGNVWVANYFGSTISEVSSAGAVLLNGKMGGGVDHPQAVAIDGARRVWVSNFHAGTLSEFAGSNSAVSGTPLSPATGLGTDAQLGSPFALAVDASGNLWVTNSNGANTVTVFIGLASPVKTPLLGPQQFP